MAADQPDIVRPSRSADAARHIRHRAAPSLRGELPTWRIALMSLSCVLLCFGLWWFATWGENEQRWLSPTVLPSPHETFATWHSLWFDRALTRNALVTIVRVALGFALAVAVGVPLGILGGCFPSVRAFLLPLVVFGRNIPIAALVPLSFFFFGVGEFQKIMFIFLACVAFLVADSCQAIIDVGQEYVDTAYTLGANRRQVVLKVLVPLALPAVFHAARLLFGLAFGYIMLAELIKLGDEEGGLGHLINVSQKRGPREHIFLLLLVIPMLALLIDGLLYWIQRQLFPYRYGGRGILNRGVRVVMHGWEDIKWFLLSLVGLGPPMTPRAPASSEDSRPPVT